MIQNLKINIKNNIKWIVLAIFCALVILITLTAIKKENVALDKTIYNFIITNFKSNGMTTIMKIITNIGGAYVIIAVATISIVSIKNKKVGISIFINMIIISIINYVLKILVQRPRPIGSRLVNVSGYSFPSGHSMTSMAFYGLIIYWVYNKIKNKMLRNIICILLSLIILLIGISRIYLGVHYATDVIAGFMLAIIYLIVYVEIYNINVKDKTKNNEGEKNE